jgi:hypothetical protein
MVRQVQDAMCVTSAFWHCSYARNVRLGLSDAMRCCRCRLSVAVSLTRAFGAAGSLICAALDMTVLTVSARDIGTDRGLQGDKVPPNWLEPNSGTIGVFTGFVVVTEAWQSGVRSGYCW